MKSSIVLISVLVLWHPGRGQDTLSLASCYERAAANYPLVAQRGLIDITRSFSIENAAKGHLPQVSIGGQATYQSAVTRIPIEMPGIEPLSKDQYRVFAEISQGLYRGGVVPEQKKAEEVSASTESQKLEVELYELRRRVDELFFGILLLQEQQAQSQLVKQDLLTALRNVEANIQQGSALLRAADVLQAEILRMDQRIIEQQAAESAFRQMLGRFINENLSPRTILLKPDRDMVHAPIARPELKLFDYQQRGIEANLALLAARKRPRIELFIQGGYGRPGLNMLENSFDFFYVGGIRFAWMLSGYYTFRREKELLEVRRQSLDVQKETFLFNTDLVLVQHEVEVEKLDRLMAVDDEIIALRMRVLETASVQLKEGVISAADYVREVNAADQAKQNRALHEIQLLMAQAKYRFTRGETGEK